MYRVQLQVETVRLRLGDAGVSATPGAEGTALPPTGSSARRRSGGIISGSPAPWQGLGHGGLRPRSGAAPGAGSRAQRRRTPATPHAARQANAGGRAAPPGRRSAAARAAPPAALRPLPPGAAAALGWQCLPLPPLPPLQPFGRCVTRRFLPTWRLGQIGGDGGQFAATAGANPHSRQGSAAGVGPLSRRRLSPQPSAAQAALRRRPPGRRLSEGDREAPPAPADAEVRAAQPCRVDLSGALRTLRPSPRPEAGPPAPSEPAAALHASPPPPPLLFLVLPVLRLPRPASGSRGSDQPPPPSLRPCMRGRRRRTCS